MWSSSPRSPRFFGISKLQVDDSLSELFRTDTQEFRDYEMMSERFPSSEYDVLIVVTGDKLLQRDSIEALRTLITELQFVDGMTGLVSLFSARQAPKPGKIPGPVFPAELPKGAAYDRLIDEVRENEIISGKLLSDDGTLTLILLALDREVVASKGLNSVVEQIRDTAAEYLKGTGLGMKLSGAPVMQLEIRNAVERDRNLYNALGFLFAAIIAYAFFRRLSLMVIAALPPVDRHHLVARPVRLARVQAQSVPERHDPADHGARLLRFHAAHGRHAQPAARGRPAHEGRALCGARGRAGLRLAVARRPSPPSSPCSLPIRR